jgi:hypothetical protein
MDLDEFSNACTIIDTDATRSMRRSEAARVRAAMLRRPANDSVRTDIHIVANG